MAVTNTLTFEKSDINGSVVRNETVDIFCPEHTLQPPQPHQLPSFCTKFKCPSNVSCDECIAPKLFPEHSSRNTDDVYTFRLDERTSREDRRSKLKELVAVQMGLNPEDGPITLFTLNGGYSYLFLNWLCSLHHNNIAQDIRDSTIIIATDDVAKDTAERVHFHVVRSEWLQHSIDEEALSAFGLGAHKWTNAVHMVYISDLNALGYDVLSSDVDTIWIRDIRTYFENDNDQYDVAMPFDGRNDGVGPGNSGLIYVRSNCATKTFMSTLIHYIGAQLRTRTDQMYWNMLLKEYKDRVQFKLLPVDVFVNGHVFFGKHVRNTTGMWFAHASWTDTHGKKQQSNMAIEAPPFHPGYAASILIFLAACASLFKPKKDYVTLKLSHFPSDDVSSFKARRVFCLARVQYWSIWFIYYYAIPHVAIGLYLLTIALSIGISVSRINTDFHGNLNIIRDEAVVCENAPGVDPKFIDDLVLIAEQTQSWSDQLTWLLIAYFFQKMFGATLLINGGGSVLVAALVFDPWLLLTTFWGTHMEDRMLYIINHDSMEKCFNQWDNDHDLFTAVEMIIKGVNNINICLWTMGAMSLSAGLVIDIICTSIREFEYCLRRDLNENQSCWNKLFCCIHRTVQEMDDRVEEALGDVGLKTEEDSRILKMKQKLSRSNRV